MAGINEAGVSNPNDYVLGRGKVYISDLSAGLPTDYRFIGNCTEFLISQETETLDHQSSRTGLKVTDKEVTLSSKVNLTMTIDELNFDNVGLFFGATVSQNSDFNNDTSHETTITDPIGGRWYDLVDQSGGSGATDPEGFRSYNVTSMTSDVGVETTDWILDKVFGRVFIVNDAACDGNTTVFTAVTPAGEVVDELFGFEQTAVSTAVKFVSINPAASDHQTEYQFHQVTLKPEGDFGLITDDWTTMTFKGTAEKNTLINTQSPIVTIRTYDTATA